MAYEDLTARQKNILMYIRECINERHLPPSVREIADAVGLSSPSSVHAHLGKLEEKGYIVRYGSKSRSMSITEKGDEGSQATEGNHQSPITDKDFATLPLVGRVAAGSPILAEQNIEEEIKLPIALVGDSNSFLLTVRGTSMIEAGILNGDIVIVKETSSPNNGDIVVALLEDGATVKTFYQEKDCIRLQPQNSALEPIYTRDAQILGVVTGLFRSI